MRALNNIQQNIERSFEKAIYEVLLANEYIPNRVTFAANPTGYENAKTGIITAKGFCVELFGQSPSQEKPQLAVPRIVINSLGFQEGSAGLEFGVSYKANGSTFNKYLNSGTLSNLRMQVTLVSNKTSQDRLLESVRQASLPNLSYIADWQDGTVKYLIQYSFNNYIPELSHGLITRSYIYTVIDVCEFEPDLLQTGISKITDIKVKDKDNENIVDITAE